MNFHAKQLKKLVILSVSAVLPLFAGCGGGDGDEGGSDSAQTDSGAGFAGALMCVAVLLVSGDDQCVENAVSGSSSGSSGGGGSGSGSGGGSGSTPPPGSNPTMIKLNLEFEPNNSLANANIMSYPMRNVPSDKVGWMVDATVSDIDDAVDVFTFTSDRSGNQMIQLCAPGGPGCVQSVGIDPLTAFFRILDQHGTVLRTTQGGAVGQNAQLMHIDSGALYYIEVSAADTMGATFEYSMRAYDAD